MRIEITHTKLESSDSLIAYAEKRMQLLEKFLKRLEQGTEAVCYLELARTTKHHKKGDVYYAEASIEVSGKKIRATSTASDMRVALDDVKEKLEQELRKDKGKELAQRRVLL
ncbi:ribosomal subunit interface protein [Candidatus Woesearchaeota archaeon CG10_big_fil_rev_8_21_14_0_10_47_5]|nr:MAG: ribosomal subunit interface protein [Candidatus Woesearchaeota archaeon CG10_big_fil_rev_8_21_14_0_10_47_5]